MRIDLKLQNPRDTAPLSPVDNLNTGVSLSINASNALRPFDNAIITGHYGFVFEKTRAGNRMMIITRSSFTESSVFKMVSSTLKEKTAF